MSEIEVTVNDPVENPAEEQVENKEETPVTETSPEDAGNDGNKPSEEKPAAEDVSEDIKKQQESIEDAKGVLNDKGLDYEALSKEYEEHGALSSQTYADLAKAGFSKNMVDTFIAGIEAANDRFVNTVYGYAGGEAEYQKVAQYIGSKGQADVDSFNALLETGNLSAIKMVIAGAKAEMTLRTGTSNPSVLGGNNGAPVGGFANEADMVKAMSDPRYGTDEDYTKTVQTKLSKSNFIAFNK